MKRLIWLLIFAFGTALAQVSPVDMGVKSAASCGCCEEAGACGMPDCVPPPASGQPALQSARTVTSLRVAVRRAKPASRVDLERIFGQPSFQVTRVLSRATRQTVALAVSVPLFREHCSLLI